MTRKNKSFFSLSAILAITIFSTGLLFAQPGGGRQQGPPSSPSDKQIEKMVKQLDKELDLSDEQYEQVSEMYFAHFEKVEALMEGSQRPDRTKMQSLQSKLETDVKALLDQDQQKLYTAYLEDQEEQRSSQRPQGGRPPR